MKAKTKVRYEFDWKINTKTGDCTAKVKRVSMKTEFDSPTEISKFQIEVSKYVFRMFPWPNEKTFKQPPEEEYERLSSVAKAFYAGANKQDDFFYWELPKEDTCS